VPLTAPVALTMRITITRPDRTSDDLAAGKTETLMKADIEAVLKAH
jgi:hypothetical protein